MERSRFVFSGSGGQGMITASIILAEAAVLYENLNAVQTQVYGAAVRGGSIRSDVIISDSEIFFPKVNQPNVLVCLTQESYNKLSHILRPGGLLITDTRYVQISRTVDAIQKELPMYESVLDKIGKPIVFNICMLGAVTELSNVIKLESLHKILEERIPPAFLEMNRQALKVGVELARKSMA
ncbi:MAG: 2-oxoacid:acceptor oxidoreductase family protein [Desulfomonilaceae bacterium]